MATLTKKIDFAAIICVNNANPNGDPLNGNRPRTTYDNLGEISDVAIKRKIRNRLQDMNYPIFVQSEDNNVDNYPSLRARAEALLKDVNPSDKRNTRKLLVRPGLMYALLVRCSPLVLRRVKRMKAKKIAVVFRFQFVGLSLFIPRSQLLQS